MTTWLDALNPPASATHWRAAERVRLRARRWGSWCAPCDDADAASASKPLGACDDLGRWTRESASGAHLASRLQLHPPRARIHQGASPGPGQRSRGRATDARPPGHRIGGESAASEVRQHPTQPPARRAGGALRTRRLSYGASPWRASPCPASSSWSRSYRASDGPVVAAPLPPVSPPAIRGL